MRPWTTFSLQDPGFLLLNSVAVVILVFACRGFCALLFRSFRGSVASFWSVQAETNFLGKEEILNVRGILHVELSKIRI